jgi:hypothetical protein
LQGQDGDPQPSDPSDPGSWIDGQEDSPTPARPSPEPAPEPSEDEDGNTGDNANNVGNTDKNSGSKNGAQTGTSSGSSGGGGGSANTPKTSPAPSLEPSPSPTTSTEPTASPQPSPIAPPTEDFADVTGPWSDTPARDLISRGIIRGYETDEGTIIFQPERLITRAEIVQMLFVLSGENAGVTDDILTNAAEAFTDFEAEAWYAKAVAWASKHAIVVGYEDATFRPSRNVTRQEMAVIFAKYAAYKNIALNYGEAIDFGDESAIADWAIKYAKYMQRAGIINGDDLGNFNPQNNTKRAEAAQMMYNLVNL